MTTAQPFDPRWFGRQDEQIDTEFYTTPRLTVHIDEGAIAAVTDLYRELLPENGVVLDLMSSWRSHLPEDRRFSRVIGLGMNAAEMAANPRLDEHRVRDLNVDPSLPFDDAAFDGVVVTVSVQYLTRPVDVFREVNRVLKLGGPFVVTFSNRCFPTKAVAVWRGSSDHDHVRLVAAYFHHSGQWGDVNAQDRSPSAAGGISDPLFAVWAHKRAGEAPDAAG